MTIRILVGDAIEQLRTLADESIHCVVTSPPYFGLRDYGIPPQVWGGDPGCEHEWEDATVVDSRHLPEDEPSPKQGTNTGSHQRGVRPGDFCRHCNAWRGSLGLEPTLDLYLDHMVEICREIRRVLRKDGTFWLNLGSSYADSWGAQGRKGEASGLSANQIKNAPQFGSRTGSRGVSGDKRPSRSRQPPRDLPYGSDGKERSGFRAIGSACFGPDGEPQDGSRCHHDRTPDSDQLPQQSVRPGAQINRDTEHLDCAEDLASLALLASRLSTNPALPENARDAFARATRVWDDLLEAPTSLADALQYVRKAACSGDNGQNESASRIQDTGVSGSACGCGSCGKCFVYLAMKSLRFKPKDLMLVPDLLALALQAEGWYLRRDIIWSKPNPMPESVTDRPTTAHEYLFLLTKSERYHYDADAIRERAIADEPGEMDGRPQRLADGSNANDGRNYRQPRHGEAPEDYDRLNARQDGLHSKIGRKGNAKGFRGGSYVGGEPGPRTEHGNVPSETFSRNKRSVWTVATAPFKGAHFATFPPKLIEPCILAGCPAGGTVLDPFAGAGTTGLVANRLGRSAILIELNPEYAAMAERRIRGDSPLLTEITAVA